MPNIVSVGWHVGMSATVLLMSACGGSALTPPAAPSPVADQRDTAGQAYLGVTTEAGARWKAVAAMACNRKAANEESWPVMADYFAAQAAIDQDFVRGVQHIDFPSDVQADASTVIGAFSLRAEDFTRLADQERAQQSPDFASIHKDGAVAVAASRRLRADLGVTTTVQDLTAPCDLAG